MIRQHINKSKNTLHLWKRFLTWDRRQCIWAQTLGKLNELLLSLACLTCPRANVFCVFMCSCASVPTCLACLYASRANVSCVLTCPSINAPCVFFVPTCLRAHIFVIVLSFFCLWNKTVIHSYIALTRRKPLMGAMTDFAQ